MKQVEERYISFEASKMAYRDIKNSVDTAKREGIEIGMAKGMEKGRAEGKHRNSTTIAGNGTFCRTGCQSYPAVFGNH